MPVVRRCLDCGARTTNGTRCLDCASQKERRKNRRSPYQSRTWRQLRKARRAAGARECAVCGRTRYVAQHHVENVRAGGDLDGKTVPLCASCHGRYEADVRADRDTEHRRLVDALSTR